MAANSFEVLIEALRCLPGVGPKSAQRMAYHLLQRDQSGARKLAVSIDEALSRMCHCQHCNNFSEETVCRRCTDNQRDESLLCVVEMPADVVVFEQTLAFNGLYYVLMGRLSPLDGIGPRELGLERLIERCADGKVAEVILATNFGNEGEATAHLIGESLKTRGIRVSRLSRGIPLGADLEHADGGTIAQAYYDRRVV